MNLIETVTAPVRRILSSPLDQLNRWQRTGRYAVGLIRYGAAQLEEDRASQMAAALTYRTIFSLVPLFVLSLLVFNAFGGFSSVGGNLRETIYDYLGLTAITISQTTGDDAAAVEESARLEQELGPIYGPEPRPGSEELPTEAQPTGEDPTDIGADQFRKANESQPNPETKARVDQLLTDLQKQVSEISFSGIAMVGVLLLIWAAIGLVVSLERAFNRIYRAPQGRPWHLRIMIYWGVITLGPVLLAVSFYLTNQVFSYAREISGVGWLVGMLPPFASLALSWLLLLLLYSLMPNVKVQLQAALIGSLTAAVLWELSKWGFGFYMSQAVGYSKLYGSLGLLPLFLLWMYTTWLIILFGLEISYISQTIEDVRYLRVRPKEETSSAVTPPAAILAVAAALGRAFDRGESLAISQLTSTTGLPARAIEQFTGSLCRAHLAHQLEGDDDGPGEFSLARPAEAISLQALLGVGRDITPLSSLSTEPATTSLFSRLSDAEDQATHRQTLRDLIGQPPRPAADHESDSSPDDAATQTAPSTEDHDTDADNPAPTPAASSSHRP